MGFVRVGKAAGPHVSLQPMFVGYFHTPFCIKMSKNDEERGLVNGLHFKPQKEPPIQ